MFPTVIKRFRIPNFQSPVFIIMVVGTLIAMGQPASARINWDNPCDYLHRNRTTREIRTRELKIEVHKAIQDFKKLEKDIINTIYNPKLKFCNKHPPKANYTLRKYYKDFRRMGPKIEKLLEKKIISQDGTFSEPRRLDFLSQIGNRTKSILCELDDVLNLSRRRARRGRNSRAHRSAEIRSNLTNTIAEDSCAFAAYKKLLHSLKSFLSANRRTDHSEKLSKRGAKRRQKSEDIATRRRNRSKRRKHKLKKTVI